MIKDTNERIAITLTKEQIDQLNKMSEKTGYSKSILVKMAINRLIQQDYTNLISWKEWLYRTPSALRLDGVQSHSKGVSYIINH